MKKEGLYYFKLINIKGVFLVNKCITSDFIAVPGAIVRQISYLNRGTKAYRLWLQHHPSLKSNCDFGN